MRVATSRATPGDIFMKNDMHRLSLLAATLCLTSLVPAQASPVLSGWAIMPANTFSDGPTSGQFAGAGAGGNPLPLVNKQPAQGFSAILAGPTGGTYLLMPDNGFGTQGNSADALLRMYALRPDFRTASGGSGAITPVGFTSGTPASAFGSGTFLSLADPTHQLGFAIQADYTNYYNNAANPLVDASIRAGRLLTGADLDIESVRKDKNGNFWFGDEFGPFLVKTDATGKVLRPEIGLTGVFSPQNPYLAGRTPTLNGSNGFEGMAINAAGSRLYTLLEGTVVGDTARTLRINEFDIDSERYTGATWRYKLDAQGTNIGDMTALDDHRFLVIERNGATATSGGTPFKKVFLIDIDMVDGDGNVFKKELVDLMNIADPLDLNGDGSNVFTFPYVTIEDVLLLDSNTLLVVNDNNYPGTGGRNLGSDPTEFLRISINAVPEPATGVLMLAGLGSIALLKRRKADKAKRG